MIPAFVLHISKLYKNHTANNYLAVHCQHLPTDMQSDFHLVPATTNHFQKLPAHTASPQPEFDLLDLYSNTLYISNF